MRLFVQSAPGRAQYLPLDEFSFGSCAILGTGRFRQTPSYVEFEQRADNGQYLVVYLHQLSANSYGISTCFENGFDFIMLGMAESTESMGAWASTLRECWPIFMELFSNGLSERYSEAALCQLKDRDDNSEKWFITTVVGNFSATTWAGAIQEDDRLEMALDRIANVSWALTEEIRWRPLDVNKLASRKARGQFVAASRTVAKYAADNVGLLTKLLGF